MRPPQAGVFATRLVIAAAVWWVLTDGAIGWDAWIIGVPAVVGTAWLSAVSLPAHGWSWWGALRFGAFFVRESWSGGVDVARRALARRMPLAPGFVEYPVGVPSMLSRVMIINTSTLLPGSLVVDSRDGNLLVHALDVDQPAVRDTLHAAEARVAAMLVGKR